MMPKMVFFGFVLCAFVALAATGPLQPTSLPATDAGPRAAGCQTALPVTPAVRRELLAAREAVWRAWFANDRGKLDAIIPEEIIAINQGEEQWHKRDAVLASAEQFAGQGGKLLRLEFARTEIQLYGDVAILYSTFLFEVENQGKRETVSGRGTEIFVRRAGVWVNSGWHLDSGR